MQTWLVQMREPRRLLRELGAFRFFAVQLVVGGNVLASLVHPVMLVWLLSGILLRGPASSSTPAELLFATAIAAGYATSAILGAAGLYRRGLLLAHGWVLLLLPLHWFLLAAASWRALYQLRSDPYRWEKTEHGLGRTSRAAGEAIAVGRTLRPPQAAPATAFLPNIRTASYGTMIEKLTAFEKV
jgi:hypothetical protein